MKKTYATLNLAVTLIMIAANYVFGVKGINGNTVGSLSAKYDNLFTPAGYAFSIWGIIFIALLFHAYYQIKKAFFDEQHNQFLEQIGPWLIVANLGNMLWLYLWLMEFTAWSLGAMFIILFSLLQIILRLNMQRWDAPFKVIRFVWWPIGIYAGWISVATIANIAAYLAKIGWSAVFTEDVWTVVMIVVATAVNLFMLINRSMREFALVGVWAIAAIAVRQWGVHENIQYTALCAVIVLSFAILIHAAKHWKTNSTKKAIDRSADVSR